MCSSEIIAAHLKAVGVKNFFLLTGGDNALWVGLRRHGIGPILAQSEDAAVHMVDAYGRDGGMGERCNY